MSDKPSAEIAQPRGFDSEAKESLLTEVVDTILRDVFQGRRDSTRGHMLSVAAKVARKHPWPFFNEVVEAEVEHRLAGGEPRNHLAAATAVLSSSSGGTA